jgi:hypothetical protein
MIIIDFYNINSEIIGHITFHLEPEKKTLSGKSNTFGRFHIRNNRNSQLRYVLRLDIIKSNGLNNSISFSIKKRHMNKELEECIKVSIDTLNQYFNLNVNESSISIENKLANTYSYYSNNKRIYPYWHICFNTIKQKFNSLHVSSKNKLKRKTIKKRHQK